MKSDNNCIINVVYFAQIALKSLFFSAVLSARTPIVSIATGTSNGSCSDTLTLPIRDWLFCSEGGASFDT